MAFMEAECPSEHMRHVIGKGGQNLARMQTVCNYIIPGISGGVKLFCE